MDRDHALCRHCRQLVRADWRDCPHCGARAPAPRTLGGVVTTVVPWLALIAAGAWWASANADAVGQFRDTARQLVRAEYQADPPVSDSAPVPAVRRAAP